LSGVFRRPWRPRPPPQSGLSALTGVAESHSESAPLSGVGSIAASGAKHADDSAPLSGVGSIAASGAKHADDSAPLSGVGAVIAAGAKSAASAAPIAGVGAIAATGAKHADDIAPLAGVGVITTEGVAPGQEAAPLSGVGVIIAVGVATMPPVVMVGGDDAFPTRVGMSKRRARRLAERVKKELRDLSPIVRADVLAELSAQGVDTSAITASMEAVRATLTAIDRRRALRDAVDEARAAMLARAVDAEEDEDLLLLAA